MATSILRPLSFERMEAAIRSSSQHPLLIVRPRPYADAEHAELVTDVLALANVRAQGERFIAFGATANGALHGLSASEHAAAEACAEAAANSVEPALRLDYKQWRIDAVTLGILTIGACDDPPYLARRDVGPSIAAGDGWLRSRNRNRRLLRSDYDRFYAQRFSEPEFSGNVCVQFATDPPTEIVSLAANVLPQLPSTQAADKLQALIAAQEIVDDAAGMHLTSIRRLSYARVLGAEEPYIAKSVDTLRVELQSIANSYGKRDLHYKFERQSHRLNFVIHVEGAPRIQAASLVLHIPVGLGIEVAAGVDTNFSDAAKLAPNPAWSKRNIHPRIETTAASIRISKSFDSLPTSTTVVAFDEPLRIYLDESAVGYKFPIRYELRGRNLHRPVTGKLYIVCPKQKARKHG
ncbi:MAG: hypothetical protein H7Y02_04040 [Candidatus Obscuribacterales bacterium]|nr:hypothetical protein [Steroidobacteraceae bacterium]